MLNAIYMLIWCLRYRFVGKWECGIVLIYSGMCAVLGFNNAHAVRWYIFELTFVQAFICTMIHAKQVLVNINFGLRE